MVPIRLVALGLVAAIACTDDTMGPGVVSADESTVTVSRDVLVSGTLADLTLESRDANGRRVTSGGHTVVFQASGGSSEGRIGPTTDRGDGTYTAAFTGTTAGTATTIEATVDGQPVTQPLPTITVVPGPMAPDRTIVRVSPRTILVGGQATLEVVVRDAEGNDVGTGGSQVVFLAAGGTSAGTIGPATDHSDGHYTATFTGTAAGTPLTVGATVDGAPVVAALPTLTVAHGVSADSSVFTVSSDTMSVNDGVSLFLQVVDSTGVPRSSGGDQVVFTVDTTGGSGRGAIDSTTDHDDGSYTATFTASQAGTVVLGATLDGAPVRGPVTVTILAIPLSPQQSSVSVSADSVAAGGTVTLTATLRDVNGDPYTRDTVAVTFTLSPDGTSTGTIDSTIYGGDGTYTAAFTGEHAGTPVAVGATINDSSQIQMLDSLGASHLPTLTVIPGPASPDSSVLSAAPAEIAPHDSAEVLLWTRDAYGNDLGRGGNTVGFQQHSAFGVSAGQFHPVVDHGDGRYSAYFIADTAGAPDTISATLDADSVSQTVSILVACDSTTVGAVSPGVSEVAVNDSTEAPDPDSAVVIPSGVTTTIRLLARDSRTCLLTAPHAVSFTTSGGTSTGTIGQVLDQGDGSYVAGFTAATAGTPTTIRATIDNTLLTSPAPTITVLPGDISAQTSVVSVSRAAVDSGAVSVVTLQARDAAGNNLVTGGRTVTFSFTGGATHGILGPVTDRQDGTYTAPYTGTVAEPGVADSITAQIDGTPIETPPAGVAVVAGTISPDLSRLSLDPASDSVPAAGDTVRVTLDAIDAAGRHLVGGGRTVLFSTSGGTSDGTFLPLPDPDDGTYSARFLATTAGTATTLGATIDGAPVTSVAPTIRVGPGAASPTNSQVLVATDTIAVGDSTTLTLDARDAFGNALLAGGLAVSFTVSMGTGVSAGTIGPVTDHGDGTYTAVFHGTAAGTPATIAATIDGDPVTTTLPTVTVR